jgi:hypothetical protein
VLFKYLIFYVITHKILLNYYLIILRMVIKSLLNIPALAAVKNAPKFSPSSGGFALAESQAAFCTCIFGVKITAAELLAHFLMRCENCVIFGYFRTLWKSVIFRNSRNLRTRKNVLNLGIALLNIRNVFYFGISGLCKNV